MVGLTSSVVLGGPAIAAGQTGNYEFRDHPGATCRYVNDWGHHLALTKVIVRPPSVWWPDTDPNDPDEHGTVGWRAILQKTNDVEGPWVAVKRTPVQRATAYDDQAEPFGATTRAPFTKQTIPWHRDSHSNRFIAVRVVVKAIWYAPDGSVIGRAQHRVVDYRFSWGTHTGTAREFCGNDVFYSD